VEQEKRIIRETDAEAIRLAKTLLRTARFGALAVLDPRSGAPLASRVAVATDLDGGPLILVSSLSEHTGGLLADPRCSLLLGEPGKGDPLAHPRISIRCRAGRLERGSEAHIRVERRYLNRHPKARLYAGFGDFAFFHLEIESASLNGGFGKAYRLSRADLIVDSSANDELIEAEQAAIDHMNADHSDAADVYARAFAKAGTTGWTITGIDAEGIDIASGDDVRRVFFAEPLASAAQLRSTLVRLAQNGRRSIAESRN
jgi:putative heme iron utilization protein